MIRFLVWLAITIVLAVILAGAGLYVAWAIILAAVCAAVCTIGDIIFIAIVGLLDND